jgi:hypothetical protein
MSAILLVAPRQPSESVGPLRVFFLGADSSRVLHRVLWWCIPALFKFHLPYALAAGITSMLWCLGRSHKWLWLRIVLV